MSGSPKGPRAGATRSSRVDQGMQGAGHARSPGGPEGAGGGACGAGEGGAPVGLPERLEGGAAAPPRVARRAASGCLGSGRAVTPHSRRAGPGHGRRQHEQHQERAGAGAEPQAGPQPGGRARAVRQDAGERGRGQGGQWRRCEALGALGPARTVAGSAARATQVTGSRAAAGLGFGDADAAQVRGARGALGALPPSPGSAQLSLLQSCFHGCTVSYYLLGEKFHVSRQTCLPARGPTYK